MRSVFDFVVTPKGSRTTSKKSVGDKELILNTDVQNHSYVNRVGTVVGIPIEGCGGVQPGDDVIVHHNVFRRFYDVRGNEKNSRSYFDEKTYFCAPDQVYMYNRDGKWNTLEGFCFVKPVESDNMWSMATEKNCIGVLKIIGDDLKDQGLEVGSVVRFRPRSEYEFVVENERLYRVHSSEITLDYGHKRDEKEYNPSWAQGG
jgi:hypothetical protein